MTFTETAKHHLHHLQGKQNFAELQAIHIRVEWMPDDAQAIDFKPLSKKSSWQKPKEST